MNTITPLVITSPTQLLTDSELREKKAIKEKKVIATTTEKIKKLEICISQMCLLFENITQRPEALSRFKHESRVDMFSVLIPLAKDMKRLDSELKMMIKSLDGGPQ